ARGGHQGRRAVPCAVRRRRLPARREHRQQDGALPAERALRGRPPGRRKVRPFELSLVGGPWGRRLAPRRRFIEALPSDEPLPPDDDARVVWTRTAFSEYASAAAFAEIASALLAAGAPIDLVAAAGDFVVDEIVHTELAARLAAALGGAVALEVDLTRLVRPPEAGDPLLAAAELVVRTSCVGEALTVPMLKLTREVAGSTLVAA